MAIHNIWIPDSSFRNPGFRVVTRIEVKGVRSFIIREVEPANRLLASAKRTNHAVRAHRCYRQVSGAFVTLLKDPNLSPTYYFICGPRVGHRTSVAPNVGKLVAFYKC